MSVDIRLSTNTGSDIIIRNAQGAIVGQFNGTAWTFTGPVTTSGYTVATLPTGALGMRAYVTDAVTPAYNAALTGGGTVKVPVFHNGTAWVSA